MATDSALLLRRQRWQVKFSQRLMGARSLSVTLAMRHGAASLRRRRPRSLRWNQELALMGRWQHPLLTSPHMGAGTGMPQEDSRNSALPQRFRQLERMRRS